LIRRNLRSSGREIAILRNVASRQDATAIESVLLMGKGKTDARVAAHFADNNEELYCSYKKEI